MSRLIPRLQMEQLTPALAAALDSKVKRLGYLGEFFQCMGNQPEALLSFNSLTEDLKKALPGRLTEVVALTVAGVMRNDYERNQHERLCINLGFDKNWVRDVNARTPRKSTSLSEEERLVQKLTLATIASVGRQAQDEFEQVVQALGAKYAVAILLLVGRYMMHAVIVNTLTLTPPVTSIFEDDNNDTTPLAD